MVIADIRAHERLAPGKRTNDAEQIVDELASEAAYIFVDAHDAECRIRISGDGGFDANA